MKWRPFTFEHFGFRVIPDRVSEGCSSPKRGPGDLLHDFIITCLPLFFIFFNKPYIRAVQPTRGNQLGGVILREGAGLGDGMQILNNALKNSQRGFFVNNIDYV